MRWHQDPLDHFTTDGAWMLRVDISKISFYFLANSFELGLVAWRLGVSAPYGTHHFASLS